MATDDRARLHADGWVIPPSVAVFAVGQLAILLVVPRGAPLPLVVAAEAIVSLPLVASLLRVGLRATATFGLAAVALGGLAVTGLLIFESLWVAALVLVLVLATLAYGLHRYELVALDLEPEGRP